GAERALVVGEDRDVDRRVLRTEHGAVLDRDLVRGGLRRRLLTARGGGRRTLLERLDLLLELLDALDELLGAAGGRGLATDSEQAGGGEHDDGLLHHLHLHGQTARGALRSTDGHGCTRHRRVAKERKQRNRRPVAQRGSELSTARARRED